MNSLSDGKLLADSAHMRHFRPTLRHPRPSVMWTGIRAVGTAAIGMLFMGAAGDCDAGMRQLDFAARRRESIQRATLPAMPGIAGSASN